MPGEAGGGGAGGHADGVLRGGRVPQQRGLHHAEGAAQHARLHLQHPPLPHRAGDACCIVLFFAKHYSDSEHNKCHKLYISTGCCKTSVKLWKHITEILYGVFLVSLALMTVTYGRFMDFLQNHQNVKCKKSGML